MNECKPLVMGGDEAMNSGMFGGSGAPTVGVDGDTAGSTAAAAPARPPPAARPAKAAAPAPVPVDTGPKVGRCRLTLTTLNPKSSTLKAWEPAWNYPLEAEM